MRVNFQQRFAQPNPHAPRGSVLPLFVLLGLMAGFDGFFTEPARPGTLFAKYPFLPWLAFIVALVVLIWTVDRWAKMLAVAISVCVLPYLGTLSTGHVYLNPAVQVSSRTSLQSIAFIVAAAGLAFAVQKQPLNAIRRVTSILFASTFLFAVSVPAKRPRVEARAEIMALAILVAGWVANHLLTRGVALKSHAAG